MKYINEIFILFKKEWQDSFLSPMTYILTGLFTILIGYLFYSYIIGAGELTQVTLTKSVLAPTYGTMNSILLFLIPILTMRSFSEEKRDETMDLLLRSPLSNMQIIFAKFLSNFATIVFMLMWTLIFPLILSISGYSDWGVVITSYIGIIFSVMCYISVGMFTSSLTENQILAVFMSFCILIGLMATTATASATPNLIVRQIMQYFSVAYHYSGFSAGAIKSFSLLFFVSFCSIFFLMTAKVLESRKW